MADTTVASASQVQKFASEFFAEYVRESLFADYFGTDENSIIQLVEDLAKGAGTKINVPLVTRLTNAGVTGDNTLEGNEEALGNYNHQLTIDQIRNAVVVGKMEQKSTAIDIMRAAKTMLKMWIAEDLRDDILQALGSPNTDGLTAYASCTEAQKDTWVAAQNPATGNHRVLFGAAQSNYSAADHSASLANVDGSNDKLTFDVVQLAKRMAKKADPHIRPHTTKKGREFFVLFCESFSFRDLKADTETTHITGGVRGSDNPMFQDPDLMLDGVICREIPEIAALSNVGASGTTDVGPNYLCGAQAVAVAWGQRSQFVTKTDIDYNNKKGCSVGEIRGVEKLSYNDFQHGVLTIYTSGVADS